MMTVPAPEGFEGAMYFDDAIREYRVSVRAVGDTWWTNCGTAGHAYLTPGERMTRAVAAIERHLAIAKAEGKTP